MDERSAADSMNIEVAYCHSDRLTAQDVHNARRLLSTEELSAHERFVRDNDRRDYAIGHAILRVSLAYHVGIDPRELRFELGTYGKPSVARDLDPHGFLHFNLAHTNGFVACAIARRIGLGIDVEVTSRSVETSRLAARFFSRPELASFNQCPSPYRTERFIELWTLKEAYVKGLGVGLNHPLNRHSFVFLDEEWLQFEAEEGTQHDWRFALFAPTRQLRLALAVRQPSSARRPITLQWTEHGRSCLPFPMLLRSSAGLFDGRLHAYRRCSDALGQAYCPPRRE